MYGANTNHGNPYVHITIVLCDSSWPTKMIIEEESLKYIIIMVHFTDPTHQPRSLMGVALNSTSIHLTWDSPPEEHHNGEIDSYTVLCSEMNSGGSLSRHSTPTTNITITGLHPYFTYHCNVSAVTVGHGPFSTVTSITTLEDG